MLSYAPFCLNMILSAVPIYFPIKLNSFVKQSREWGQLGHLSLLDFSRMGNFRIFSVFFWSTRLFLVILRVFIPLKPQQNLPSPPPPKKPHKKFLFKICYKINEHRAREELTPNIFLKGIIFGNVKMSMSSIHANLAIIATA